MMEKPFMPAFFHQMNKRMMEAHMQILEKYELNRVHVPILMVISEHTEGLYQSELARKLYYNRAHMSRTLKELLERHFIMQEDKNTYKNRYFITEQGMTVATDIKEAADNVRRKVFSVLTPEEIAEFERLVKKMTKAL